MHYSYDLRVFDAKDSGHMEIWIIYNLRTEYIMNLSASLSAQVQLVCYKVLGVGFLHLITFI